MLRLFRRRTPEPARFDEADVAAVAAWFDARIPGRNNPGIDAVGVLAALTVDRNRRKGL